MTSYKPKKQFHITKRNNKSGEIAVVKHLVTGFRSVSVCGKIKLPYRFVEPSTLHSSINEIGLKYLRLFPSILSQKKDNSIYTYTIPATRSHYMILHYAFQYIINDGPDTRTVINELLSKNNLIIEALNACVFEDGS